MASGTENNFVVCTGGNTSEYAEYYSKRPNEYGIYMDLFNAMVDAILTCKKPTICRVNGMRGGQEIGMTTDIRVSSDPAVFGQVSSLSISASTSSPPSMWKPCAHRAARG